MKTKLLMIAAVLILNGCTNLKYPNWQYVRIEHAVPSKDCVYKMQESCSEEANQCMDWHKQRATKFNANTVVITQSESQQHYSVGMWKASGGDNTSTLADYYYCNGAKNLNPA